MTKAKNTYTCNNGCPVESTLQFISGKWKSVIIYHLIKGDATHFGELSRAMPSCSTRMLALQLKELETDNIISKKVYSEFPPKSKYFLTDFGQTLQPVILALNKWGKFYNEHATAKDMN
ncbi:helix-turn-helix domain-containing protein [Lactobacillus sp. ESL0677]|uniref:winged helix-turn-helix transcriptional regulator n=1 Tax=Lactobacillus sp. ESL0677 TaxID=2983208 RepID=UPI0023F71DA3|nr:helix-turn-helix domain-containing protein [Lactobacillus sp. ESL0677]WEV36180.1 helix-turn-helix domain-containing protein [Lactobacillus sp. ESL0677]